MAVSQPARSRCTADPVTIAVAAVGTARGPRRAVLGRRGGRGLCAASGRHREASPPRRSSSQLDATTSAPEPRTRARRPRSADTRTTGVSAVAATLASVSSPSPGAWTTVTPSAAPSSTPWRAVPSTTITTGSGSRDAAVAVRTRSASRRVAARSRHQPVGRGPTTLAVSISSMTPGSRAAPPTRPHP
jgi:hypothetical protein